MEAHSWKQAVQGLDKDAGPEDKEKWAERMKDTEGIHRRLGNGSLGGGTGQGRGDWKTWGRAEIFGKEMGLLRRKSCVKNQAAFEQSGLVYTALGPREMVAEVQTPCQDGAIMPGGGHLGAESQENQERGSDLTLEPLL